MSLQSIRINRSTFKPRSALAAQALMSTPRALRQTEQAMLDGLQAWARSGHGLTVLIGVANPSPLFDYDLPVLRATAPLTPSPYGLFAQLLTTASNMTGARAALRAVAHSLSFMLPQSLADGVEPSTENAIKPAAALLQLFERLAGDTPLVIHLDHLQRADEPSLKLLRDLTTRLNEQPILIVGTYQADHTFSETLRELLNDFTFVQVSCAPSWSDDLTLLLDALFGRKAPIGMMIEAVKNDERQLLIGGVGVIEACRRSGRWTDGLTLSERVIELAQSTEAEYVGTAARLIRADILSGLGQWPEAQAEYEQVLASPPARKDRSLQVAAAWGAHKAKVSSGVSKQRALPEAVRRWRTHARTSDDPATAAALMADVIDFLLEADRVSEARSWERDLEALVEHSGHPAARYAVAQSLGALLVRSNDWRAAVGAYRAAAQHASALHDLLFEARATGGLALSLLELGEQGDGECKLEGRERLSIAHSVLSRLNARPDVERYEAGAKRFGLRPRQRRPSAANRTPGSLTRREREVLALVMNGLTNRQIAQRLTISEKTAEGHVGNILAKLSCSSRIKAAELARATGLLEGSAA
jgi:DNA-binding CsgD family transcriptional regulator/tetratricopeptide (TPR) repeat protein